MFYTRLKNKIIEKMSKSLRSLTKNERMSESLIFLGKSLIRSFFLQKTSDLLGNQMSEFPALSLGYT